MNDNPFQAPQTSGVDAADSVISAGTLLAIDGDTVLPPLCVKSGMPIPRQNYRTRTLVWYPRYVGAMVFVGLFLAPGPALPLSLILWAAAAIVYFNRRRKCRVTYGVSSERIARYRWRKIGQLAAITTGCSSIAVAIWRPNDVSNTLAVAAFAIAIVSSFGGNLSLWVAGVRNGKFLIGGCSPAFLVQLEE